MSRGVRTVGDPPRTQEEWAALGAAPAHELAKLGLRRFGREEDEHGEERPDGRMLWVFPREWYDRIPAGTPIVDIFFKSESFRPGETDDDHRFGCLAFGTFGPP